MADDIAFYSALHFIFDRRCCCLFGSLIVRCLLLIVSLSWLVVVFMSWDFFPRGFVAAFLHLFENAPNIFGFVLCERHSIQMNFFVRLYVYEMHSFLLNKRV